MVPVERFIHDVTEMITGGRFMFPKRYDKVYKAIEQNLDSVMREIFYDIDIDLSHKFRQPSVSELKERNLSTQVNCHIFSDFDYNKRAKEVWEAVVAAITFDNHHPPVYTEEEAFLICLDLPGIEKRKEIRNILEAGEIESAQIKNLTKQL